MTKGKEEGVCETGADPVQRRLAMHLSPRCGAKTRSGRPCRAPMTGKGRCRMHGGAKGSGGPAGARNGAWRHGGRSNEALALRTIEKLLLRLTRLELERRGRS